MPTQVMDQAYREIADLMRDLRRQGIRRLPAERDLANRLDVSRATVSKILGTMSREGVVERTQGRGTFLMDPASSTGLSVGIGLRHVMHKSAAHFGIMLKSLSLHGSRLGITLQVFEGLIDHFRAADESNRVMKCADAGVIDGMLVVSRITADVLGRLMVRMPVVLVNQDAGAIDVPCVFTDPCRCGFIGAERLILAGHRRIAYVAGSLEHWLPGRHIAGVRSACEAHGVAFSSEHVLETRSNQATFVQRTRDFFSAGPLTACLVHDDSWAARLVRVLERIGKRVPDDVSIVAIGDHHEGYNSPLALTTVDTRFDDMCRAATEMMLKRLRSEPVRPYDRQALDPVLCERDSVRDLQG